MGGMGRRRAGKGRSMWSHLPAQDENRHWLHKSHLFLALSLQDKVALIFTERHILNTDG